MRIELSTQAHDDENSWAVLALTRFVLAMNIMVHHTAFFDNIFLDIARTFTGVGPAAFFMISGYSIASSVVRKPTHFYERRLWRIYPAYAFALCLSFFFLVIYGQDIIFNHGIPVTIWQVIGSFFFLQGILVRVPSCNSALWSLTVGEVCYCLAPWFRKAKPWVFILLITISATVFASRIRLDYEYWRYSQQNWGFPTATFIWLWLLGFAYFRWRGKWRWPLLLLPPILICWNFEDGGMLGLITIALTGLLLTQTIKFTGIPASVRSVFLYLGDLSYPLYLVHIPMMNWTRKLAGPNMWGHDTGWLQYSVVFVVSVLVLKFIARPSRKLGDTSRIDQAIKKTKLEAIEEKTSK